LGVTIAAGNDGVPPQTPKQALQQHTEKISELALAKGRNEGAVDFYKWAAKGTQRRSKAHEYVSVINKHKERADDLSAKVEEHRPGYTQARDSLPFIPRIFTPKFDSLVKTHEKKGKKTPFS
jgi:uncharacterized coiled-coil DUF342 family protein